MTYPATREASPKLSSYLAPSAGHVQRAICQTWSQGERFNPLLRLKDRALR